MFSKTSTENILSQTNRPIFIPIICICIGVIIPYKPCGLLYENHRRQAK